MIEPEAMKAGKVLRWLSGFRITPLLFPGFMVSCSNFEDRNVCSPPHERREAAMPASSAGPCAHVQGYMAGLM